MTLSSSKFEAAQGTALFGTLTADAIAKAGQAQLELPLQTGGGVPFDEQPQYVQDYFNNRAAKYDGLTGEDVYNMVPEHLQDNPKELMAYMEDRDISHIVSRENGGADTPENTMMERESPNRSRQERNMTEEERATAEQQNAEDARVIEETYTDDSNAYSEDVIDLDYAEGAAAVVATEEAALVATEEAAVAATSEAAVVATSEAATQAGAEVAAEATAAEILGEVIPGVSALMLGCKLVNDAPAGSKASVGWLTAGASVALIASGAGAVIPAAGLAYSFYKRLSARKA